MPLKLLPAEPSDLPRIVRIEIDSFADSPLTPILFPGGQSQESEDMYVESLLQEWDTNTAGRFMKVVDTDLGDKIISFARWYIYVGDDVKHIKASHEDPHKVLGSDTSAAEEFFGGLLRLRYKRLGRNPHCFLSTMCTDPQHQRRGAGMMLIKWGCNMAEKHGVPAFTEASPEGFLAYRKAGFEPVGVFELDMGRYGGKGTRLNTQMIWYPSEASGADH